MQTIDSYFKMLNYKYTTINYVHKNYANKRIKLINFDVAFNSKKAALAAIKKLAKTHQNYKTELLVKTARTTYANERKLKNFNYKTAKTYIAKYYYVVVKKYTFVSFEVNAQNYKVYTSLAYSAF